MKKKFTAINSEQVTFRRDGDELVFVVEGLPAGYYAWQRSVYPPPTSFLNGHPIEVDEATSGDYFDRLNYLFLAKALHSDGSIETPAPDAKATRPKWHEYAAALRAEFQEANFSEGEVQELMKAVLRLVKTDAIEGAKREAGN